MYLAGTTSATSNLAKAFMESILHDNLVTAGFTYVEERLVSGTSRVYKSAVADNAVGDWYLVVHRTSDSTTAVIFGVCEEYDVVGHLCKRWAPSGSTQVLVGQTLPADRSHYTTAGIAPNSAAGGSWSVGLSATVHPYVLSLHPKRVVMSTKVSTTDYFTYAGLYDPLIPVGSTHFPLMIGSTGTSGGASNISYSREPGTGVTTTGANATFLSSTGLLTADLATNPVPTATPDGYLLKPTVARIFLSPSQLKTPGHRGMPIGFYAGDRSFAYNDVANIDWAGVTVTATCVFGDTTADRQRLVDQAY